MTNFLIIGLLILILISVETLRNSFQSKKIPKLEIYTPSNIYYIDGLRVTDEAKGLDILFNNPKELMDFISKTTAEEIQNYLAKDTDFLNKLKKRGVQGLSNFLRTPKRTPANANHKNA